MTVLRASRISHRMNVWIRLLATCAALALVPVVPAGAQSSPGELGVTRATLANGLQIVVIRDPLAPVVATWLNYEAGSDDESITGLAHAQEHMLFRGSKTIDASQFADTTSITGGTFNADTQAQTTQFFFEMPSQYLDIALHLEASRAQGVLDAQSAWDQERGAITQEVTRDNSQATYRLYEKMTEHVFAGSPYADAGLGTVASFKQIQAPDLKRFYARWYHPNNAIYVIVGDVDPQTTIDKVRALFAPIPAKPLPPRKPVVLRPLTPAKYTEESSDPYTIAEIAYRNPGYDDRDYFASEILNDVLNSQRGALFDLQATGKSLQTFAQAQTYSKAAMEIVGSVVPAGSDGNAAARDVQTVIENYKKTGLPADLVEAAKQLEVAQAELNRNSIQGLATLWSNALAVEHRTPDDDLAGLQRVSVADVNRVLRTWYDNRTATVAIAAPKTATGGGDESGRVGENNTVIPTEHTGLPAFAKDVLANLHVPHSTLAPSVQKLPNGLTLVVQPESASHTIQVRGSIHIYPEAQDPAGKDGIDDMVSSLLPFGTTTYDRIAYQAELDKIAATASAGTTFSLDVLTQHFDRGMQLLADDELHPSFPAAAFAIVKQQTVGQLAGTIHSPDFLARKALVDGLFPATDPSRRYATPQTAGAVTLDDVKQQFAATYRPDLTTIAVIGDVTPETARAVVDKYFGDWHATGPLPDVYPPAAPPNAQSTATVPATGRIQSDVTLAETLQLTYDNPDYATLRLANEVLTGGVFGSVLYHDLRETTGYVYSVSSSLAGGRNRSVFSINYGAYPQNVGRADNLIVTDLTKLQTTPLEAGRLLRSKALVLGELPIGEQSYAEIADEFLLYADRQQPLDEPYREAQTMLDATPATLQAAMAKYVRPSAFVRVVTGPAGQ
jgi:zinc protease